MQKGLLGRCRVQCLRRVRPFCYDSLQHRSGQHHVFAYKRCEKKKTKKKEKKREMGDLASANGYAVITFRLLSEYLRTHSLLLHQQLFRLAIQNTLRSPYPCSSTSTCADMASGEFQCTTLINLAFYDMVEDGQRAAPYRWLKKRELTILYSSNWVDPCIKSGPTGMNRDPPVRFYFLKFRFSTYMKSSNVQYSSQPTASTKQNLLQPSSPPHPVPTHIPYRKSYFPHPSIDVSRPLCLQPKRLD